MTPLLCAAPRCRTRGRHHPDCAADTCTGCLPRQAADGLRLCRPHVRQLAEDATRAARVHHDLALALAGGTQQGGRVTGSPDRTRVPNPAAVECRTLIRHTLVAWCRLVAEERGIGLPRDTVADMAAYIARHAEWLAAQDYAGEASDELRELAHGRPWRVAYPDGTRRWLGRCGAAVDGGQCDADLYARTGAAAVTCRDCRAVHDVAQRDAWLDAVVRGYSYTATEIEQAYGIRAGTIRVWAHRGRLQATGVVDGQPVYPLDAVLDLAAQDAARRAGRQTRRSHAAA